MRGFKPLIVHAAPCADVRSRPSAGDGQQRRSRGNISPGWTVARTTPRTGSNIFCPSCRAAPFPVVCQAAGLRPGNICRPVTGKYSERRRMAPSRHPEAGSSHHRCCSTHALAAGLREIADNPNAELNLTINHPFVIWVQKGRSAFKRRPPLGDFMLFFLSHAFSALCNAWYSRGSWLVADALFPSLPVLPASAPAEAHQTCR